jgi:hypothetical protein
LRDITFNQGENIVNAFESNSKLEIKNLNTPIISTEISIAESSEIVGGAGLTPGEGLGLGITMISAGIGVVAMATPVGWLAGGFLYGGGMVLGMYSGYLVGGASPNRPIALK